MMKDLQEWRVMFIRMADGKIIDYIRKLKGVLIVGIPKVIHKRKVYIQKMRQRYLVPLTMVFFIW